MGYDGLYVNDMFMVIVIEVEGVLEICDCDYDYEDGYEDG